VSRVNSIVAKNIEWEADELHHCNSDIARFENGALRELQEKTKSIEERLRSQGISEEDIRKRCDFYQPN